MAKRKKQACYKTEIPRMIELYNNGYSYTEIAEKIGCSYYTVYKYLPDNVLSRESHSMDVATKIWFAREWANIYPGDNAREVIKSGQA